MNPSPPIEIAAWLACAAFVVMFVNGATKMVRNFKDRPAPGDVRAESLERFVPKPAFEKHIEENKREHENLFAKIGGVERGGVARMETLSREWREIVDDKVTELIKSDNGGREKLHERINKVMESTAALQASTTLQNQTLAQLGAKLDRLAERIP